MIIAILLLFVVHMVAAWFTTQHLVRPKRILHLPLFVLLISYCFFYMTPITISWVTGVINSITVLVAVPISGGIALFAYWRDRTPAISGKELLAALRAIRISEVILLVTIGLICLALAAVAAVAPMRWADAMTYHSLQPMYWAQHNAFNFQAYGDVGVISYAAASVFPNVKGLLAFLVLEWSGQEYGTAAVQIPFLPLFLCALFVLFRELGFSKFLALIGSAFSLVTPEVLMNSMEGYADIIFYAGIHSIIAFLVIICNGGLTRAMLVPIGLSFAVATGAKPFALLTCGVLGLFLLIAVFWKGAAGGVTPRLVSVGAAFGSVVLLCLFSGGPWYLYGLVEYRNPVYPVQVAVGDTVIFPGYIESGKSTSMSEDRLGGTGLLAWWRVMSESYRPGIVSPWDAGFGAHAIVIGVPALLLFLIFSLNSHEWRRYLPITIILFSLIFATGSPLIPRYNLFHLVAYGLGFVYIISRSPLFFRWSLLSLFFALSVYNIARVVPSIMFRARPAALVAYSFFTGDHRPLLFDGFPGELRALDFWKEAAPPGSVLATEPVRNYFYLFPHEDSNLVVEIPELTADGDPGAWVDSLVNSGATHFLTDFSKPSFRFASSQPAFFEPVFAGQEATAVTHMMMKPRPSDVLFRVTQAGGAQ